METDIVTSRVFLSAEWRYLAMLNYRVAPELLTPLVPAGTQLDLWEGDAYVSVVGFLFQNTRVLGVPIPFHRTFVEVNLRFYVRREVGGEVRRAVTFIRELVPRTAIAAVARLAYNEPYRAVRMRHRVQMPTSPAGRITVAYEWMSGSRWSGIHVGAEGGPTAVRPGSHEEFIAEHYWGYTRRRDGGTTEYEVHHPRWSIWPAQTARLDGDLSSVYPGQFVPALSAPPDSAFLADGSAVTVSTPVRLGPKTL